MNRQQQITWDAIVIGGGPGGSSAASYLARAGRRVLLLEREFFPRFHIGESLLPYNASIFRELGVWDELQNAGFPRKYGAQFHLGSGSHCTRFVFAEGKFTREHEVVQVERSRFDHILLKHARKLGADAREGWTVKSFANDPEGVTVTASDPDGHQREFLARFLLDASGRANLTGNQEGLRVNYPHLKKLAIFGHFTNVQLDEGRSGGDTVIVRLENKWFWIIPVSPEKASVGLVLDKDEFNREADPPEQIFRQVLESSPPIADRMKSARAVGPMQVTTDFSYYNQRLVSKRLLRIGDAAGFMDPIFSAGVYLAMWSGRLAAEVVSKSISANDNGARRLARYEKRVWRGVKLYWRMVEHYYTQPFIDLFMQPKDHAQLASAVNAALAGELEGGWRLWWRLRYFFLLVKLQSRWPLVPPIAASGTKTSASQAHTCVVKS